MKALPTLLGHTPLSVLVTMSDTVYWLAISLSSSWLRLISPVERAMVKRSKRKGKKRSGKEEKGLGEGWSGREEEGNEGMSPVKMVVQ